MKKTQIVLHHTVPSIPKEQHLSFYMNSGKAVSTHFFIDKDGTIHTS